MNDKPLLDINELKSLKELPDNYILANFETKSVRYGKLNFCSALFDRFQTLFTFYLKKLIYEKRKSFA